MDFYLTSTLLLDMCNCIILAYSEDVDQLIKLSSNTLPKLVKSIFVFLPDTLCKLFLKIAQFFRARAFFCSAVNSLKVKILIH